MKTSILGFALVSAVSILVGCSGGSSSSDGSSESAGSGASSDTAPLACHSIHDGVTPGSVDTCQSFSAMPNDERSQWCTYPGDTVVSSCPTNGVVATCTFTDRLGVNVVYFYQDDADYDPDSAKNFCDEYRGTMSFN